MDQLRNDIRELKTSVNYIKDVVDTHMEADSRRQERVDDKMEQFFSSVSDLKDEFIKMNFNMIQYNSHLEEHMRRTEANEKRLEHMENRFLSLSENQTIAYQEIQKFNTATSTVLKVFIGIGGILGVIWTLLQIIDKLR